MSTLVGRITLPNNLYNDVSVNDHIINIYVDKYSDVVKYLV